MATSDLDAKLISQGTQVTSVDGAALVPVATAEGQPQNNITVEGLADSMGAQAAESVNITSLWGQTEEGKMVRITNQSAANIIGNLLYGATNKNDLATVVAGIMHSDGLFPFRVFDSYASISELDSYIYSGIYAISQPSSTINGWTAYGTIIVFSTKKNFVTQLFIHAELAIAFRTSTNNGSSWRDWATFALS